ncbi:MAG TPA: hypothetical protein VJ302_15505 [Blastocatellia bacterium]|nr:hypothetical protein [Blastocatellia bacterium]
MKSINSWLFAIIAALVCGSWVRAQETHQHHHQHEASEKLGQVNFTISCGPAAQKQFNRAAALLHSFWYEEAEKAFAEVTKADSGCAMGYWGVAMSNYHPIWAPPDPAELKRGVAAIEQAKTAKTKTDRERDYIGALAAFYQDSDKVNHRARAEAYAQAMEQVYRRYPKDREAAIFYSLALLGTAVSTDKSYARQKQAAEILNQVLPQEPEHPGVAHYLIHSFDYPQLAQLALPAARSYAKIAPSSPHALHMPSHIFTRLGLWQESIQSNLASAEAARRHVAATHPGSTSFDRLHAQDYLVYAYLQGQQDYKAEAIEEELSHVDRVDVESFAAAYALAAVPARFWLEKRHWEAAAELTVRPQTFPWKRYPYAEAITHFARAMGAARSGRPAAAEGDLENLTAIQAKLAEAKDPYWAGQVEIQRREAAAWLARAEGDNEKALTLMRSAVELEEATEKHPVTPGPIIPAREQLGDLLLELDRPEQALREYEASLANSPNRYNGIYGAAHAAELLGDMESAKNYYTKLLALCGRAEGGRPELAKARSFLAQQ